MCTSNSTTGNENPFSRLITPADKNPQWFCKGCHIGFYGQDDLNREGFCASCCQTKVHFYTCYNCSYEWEQKGIIPICPNCGHGDITTDDRFVDNLISEAQKVMPGIGTSIICRKCKSHFISPIHPDSWYVCPECGFRQFHSLGRVRGRIERRVAV